MDTNSVFEQILEWSQAQPVWLQDALRRVIKNETLTATDINELVLLCKVEKFASDYEELKTIPLSSKDLPLSDNKNKSISLGSLGDLENINRLPSDQIIQFGENPGLTIIYGENGSGKTGYSRVLKKICRSRGSEPIILSNVFESELNSPQKAVIKYQIENSGPTQFNWTQDGEPNSDLANVFVFDTQTAEHYITYDDEVSFTPFGLDILPKLVTTYDQVGKKIDEEVKDLEKEIEVYKIKWDHPDESKIAQILNRLNKDTDQNDIVELAEFSKLDAEQLVVIQETLKSDPIKKSIETKAVIKRFKDFLKNLDDLIEIIDDLRISNLEKQLAQLKIKSRLAEEFSSKSFENYLGGTGKILWKKMWESAKSFSVTEVYPDKEFPVLDDAKCVLCQQDLLDDAKIRMKEFNDFITDKSQEEAKETNKLWDELVTEIEDLNDLDEPYKSIAADLQTIEESEKLKLKIFVEQSTKRLTQIKKYCTDKVWESKITDLPESPKDFLSNYIAVLEKREVIEASASDPEQKKKLEQEKEELETRQWFSNNLDEVLNQIERYNDLGVLQECRPVSSKFITQKNSEITREVVTDVYCNSFDAELKELGLKTLSVELEPLGGVKAHTKFGLRLKEAKSKKLYDIASEGEQRCIALAAFFAELSQASHKSALVFDDPVSSLDHWFRDRMAKRLIKESISRQVIVFTHDLIFVNQIRNNSNQSQVLVTKSLQWDNGKPGYVFDRLPWDCISPKQQIHELKILQSKLRKSWNPQPNDQNVSDMRSAYSLLRTTIEHVIEQDLFGGIVTRFNDQIIVGRMLDIAELPINLCKDLKNIYQDCHTVSNAHLVGIGKHNIVPDPDEFLLDIELLEILRDDVNVHKEITKI